jgi:large subunit ribosomal protein L32
MAVPKKATSVSRKGKRRAGQHHKLYRKFPFQCPNCGSLALPHKVCSSCGVYKGTEIIELKAQDENPEETEA